MESRRSQAAQTLQTFLNRADRHVEVDDGTPLFAGGLELDSLETAELSAQLEDDLGTDPFTDGVLPQTVGELLGYYDETPAVTA